MTYSDDKRTRWGCLVFGGVSFALTFCVLFWLVFPFVAR